MQLTILFISSIVSLLVTFFTISWLIPILTEKGITGKDMNKINRAEVPEMGGVAVIIGFIAGLLILFTSIEMSGSEVVISSIWFISFVVIILISLVGIIDDIISIRQIIKALLIFLLAIPLGFYAPQDMYVPSIGTIFFGSTMIFIVPLAVTCASNSMNMLEGFNGLGAGLGIIITISMIVMAYNSGENTALLFLMPLLGSLIAFLYYNKYPARIFPGDTLTLFVGSVIACSSIISDLKFEGTLLMTPMIVEFFLKCRGRFEGECFAESNENGILKYNNRVESLTHFVMKNFTVDEKKLVHIFWSFQITLSSLIILINLNSW